MQNNNCNAGTFEKRRHHAPDGAPYGPKNLLEGRGRPGLNPLVDNLTIKVGLMDIDSKLPKHIMVELFVFFHPKTEFQPETTFVFMQTGTVLSLF